MGRYYEFKVKKAIDKEFTGITKVICKKDCKSAHIDVYAIEPAEYNLGLTAFGFITRLDCINLLSLFFKDVKFIRAYTTKYNFNKIRIIDKR